MGQVMSLQRVSREEYPGYCTFPESRQWQSQPWAGEKGTGGGGGGGGAGGGLNRPGWETGMTPSRKEQSLPGVPSTQNHISGYQGCKRAAGGPA